ncbi:hypothetical protein, partial [Dendronalium sp. ChiSLP03b]|uniref:hypothetical protein n=1 Tax=Dendronalium sp. ChiSLP03b TaxID=3075381 RepID=UPI00391D897B
GAYPLRLRDSSFCLCSVFSNTLSLRPFPISLPHFVPTLLHYFSLAMPVGCVNESNAPSLSHLRCVTLCDNTLYWHGKAKMLH